MRWFLTVSLMLCVSFAIAGSTVGCGASGDEDTGSGEGEGEDEDEGAEGLADDGVGLYDGGPHCGVSDPDPSWYAPETASRLWGLVRGREYRDPLNGDSEWWSSDCGPYTNNATASSGITSNGSCVLVNQERDCLVACARLDLCFCQGSSESNRCVQSCLESRAEDLACVLDATCGSLPVVCPDVVHRGGVAVGPRSCRLACDRLVECQFYAEPEWELCVHECLAVGTTHEIACTTREPPLRCLSVPEVCFGHLLSSNSENNGVFDLCFRACQHGYECGVIPERYISSCVAPCAFHQREAQASCRLQATCDAWADCAE